MTSFCHFSNHEKSTLHFVGHSIGKCAEIFFEDDVIIVTSVVLGIQSDSGVFCLPVLFYNSLSVKQHCELQEKLSKTTR